MTCSVVGSLSGTWMKLHSSMLGTFFVYTLTLSMPIFKKKSPRRFLEKMPKLFIVVTLLQWKVWNFLPEISAEIFSWKLAYLVSRCIQKRPPTKKNVTSSMFHSDFRLPSKSLKYFTYRVCNFMASCVHICAYIFFSNFYFQIWLLQNFRLFTTIFS